MVCLNIGILFSTRCNTAIWLSPLNSGDKIITEVPDRLRAWTSSFSFKAGFRDTCIEPIIAVAYEITAHSKQLAAQRATRSCFCTPSKRRPVATFSTLFKNCWYVRVCFCARLTTALFVGYFSTVRRRFEDIVSLSSGGELGPMTWLLLLRSLECLNCRLSAGNVEMFCSPASFKYWLA